jgi:hypothetical protein
MPSTAARFDAINQGGRPSRHEPSGAAAPPHRDKYVAAPELPAPEHQPEEPLVHDADFTEIDVIPVAGD